MIKKPKVKSKVKKFNPKVSKIKKPVTVKPNPIPAGKAKGGSGGKVRTSAPALSAGSHTLKALQGASGSTTVKERKKAEDIEKFIKHRNEFDMKGSKGFKSYKKEKSKRRNNYI